MENSGWFLTGMYGQLNASKRGETQALIFSLRNNEGSTWIVLGDFNEIAYQSEKWGNRLNPEQQVAKFHDMMPLCELQDLGFIGASQTWSNNRDDNYKICKTLDCFVVNYEWSSLFLQVTVRHGLATYSYHLLSWMDTNGHQVTSQGSKPFRFELMWLGEKDCTGIIEEAW